MLYYSHYFISLEYGEPIKTQISKISEVLFWHLHFTFLVLYLLHYQKFSKPRHIVYIKY